MQKAPYRNAIRSKKMIREALISLLAQKELSGLKTQEVIEVSGVSKGTFYAHYNNLSDVLQEIENDTLSAMFRIFDECSPDLILEDFFPLFICGLAEMEKNKELFRILFQPCYGDSFLSRVKNTFLANMMSSKLKNRYFESDESAQGYLTYVAGGAIAVIQEWISGGFPVPASDVAHFLNDCALSGLRALSGGRPSASKPPAD